MLQTKLHKKLKTVSEIKIFRAELSNALFEVKKKKFITLIMHLLLFLCTPNVYDVVLMFSQLYHQLKHGVIIFRSSLHQSEFCASIKEDMADTIFYNIYIILFVTNNRSNSA